MQLEVVAMYAQHFGFRTEPFSLTPDPGFFYLSPSHREVMAALRIGLSERRGLTVVTGEVGTGKTTVLYTLLSQLGVDMETAYVANTKLPFADLLRQICADLKITPLPSSVGELLSALNAHLLASAEKGTTVALVIDEAQHLDHETFEQLRLLSNVETFQAKLLQIVLVGQPELLETLAQRELRQVAERVAVWGKLGRLSWRDSRAYIAHRLQRAGGSPDIFTWSALQLAVLCARGNPRRINIICHDAMLFAYGYDAPRVTLRFVRSALRAGRGSVAWHRYKRMLRNVPMAPIGITAILLLILILGGRLYSYSGAEPGGSDVESRGNVAAQAQSGGAVAPPAAVLPPSSASLASRPDDARAGQPARQPVAERLDTTTSAATEAPHPPPGISAEAWSSSVAAGTIPAWRASKAAQEAAENSAKSTRGN